jgi:hypothetical protein
MFSKVHIIHVLEKFINKIKEEENKKHLFMPTGSIWHRIYSLMIFQTLHRSLRVQQIILQWKCNRFDDNDDN